MNLIEPCAELLPCPFCGEARIFLNEPTPEYRYGSINCPACLVCMPGEVRNRSELIGCWNARAERDAAATDMQERCAKTLEVRGRNDLAETIRALPVIATDRVTND